MKKKTVNPAVKFLQENLVSIGIILLMVVTAVINPTGTPTRIAPAVP